jgi:ankyrin repeat protein
MATTHPLEYLNLLVDDKHNEYMCSKFVNSTGFTILMKLVMRTKEYPNLNNYICKHIDTINDTNKKGWTALMLACRNANVYSNLDTVRILLKHGANLNLSNGSGWTALMLASRHSNTDSNLDTIKILLEYGANLNLYNNDGWTALMLAIRNIITDGNVDTVRLLLEYGANPNLQYNQYTALVLAHYCKNTDIKLETINILIDNGANISGKVRSYSSSTEVKTLTEQLAAKDQISTDKVNVNCLNCHKNKAVYVSTTCSHVLYCSKCLYSVDNICKVCNTNIKGFIRLFF